MKFITFFAILAAVVAMVAATPETNGQRLARGMPPLPPARRATPIGSARRGTPSSTPSQCNTGPVQCCNKVTKANDPVTSLLLGLLGIVLGGDVAVGVTCSPLSVIGIGGNSCSAQPVCCQNNNFNGVVAIGCSPINL